MMTLTQGAVDIWSLIILPCSTRQKRLPQRSLRRNDIAIGLRRRLSASVIACARLPQQNASKIHSRCSLASTKSRALPPILKYHVGQGKTFGFLF